MREKALIIGGSGFVGGYLIRELQENTELELHTTVLPNETILHVESVEIHQVDILNMNQISKVLSSVKPKYIVHLAAQSSVAFSWENPCVTVSININGVLNVLSSVRMYCPEATILLIGTSEEYGAVNEEQNPISETKATNPQNIYAITKNAQNQIGQLFVRSYNMNIVMTRSFNHIGPKQSEQFVVSDFCRQVVMAEKGLSENIIYVGNLAAKRDFTDVRDVVRAYRLLLSHGAPGEIYNVGSGRAVSIREISDMVIQKANININLKVDKKKFRPLDVPIIEANIEKIRGLTGWKPLIPLDKTIDDMIIAWRAMI